ncbi:MAG: hypothetical protein MJB57_15210 [Gemmatimonadetes bacterium]|nr:hypothetical protein [Gemmatimonadota bacterium]
MPGLLERSENERYSRKADSMSESIERNTESGSEVDLERRGLLKKA